MDERAIAALGCCTEGMKNGASRIDILFRRIKAEKQPSMSLSDMPGDVMAKTFHRAAQPLPWPTGRGASSD